MTGAVPTGGDTYDVIVIGAGCGGLATALFAAIAGLKPLVLESTDRIGGTTAYSAGTIWIPGTHLSDQGDPADTPDAVRRYLDLTVGNYASEALRAAFLAEGPTAVRLLSNHSHVALRAFAKHPDYLSDVDGATLHGRALEPLPFDGRRLGRDFDRIRGPIAEFTILGGMMVDRDDVRHLLSMLRSLASMRHSVRLLARHAGDRLRHGRGTRLVMGNALVARLMASLQDYGVPVWTGVTVTALAGAGRVDGVEIAARTGTRRLMATRGVVLASGGFNRNPTLRADLGPATDQVHTPGAPGHTGKALALALDRGARMGRNGADTMLWAPISKRQRPDGSEAIFPHFVLDRAKPGTVVVDQTGRRFVNESISYHLFGRAMIEADQARPAIPAFLIADATAIQRYGLGMVRPGGRGLTRVVDDGYLIRGESLADLASQISIDPETLTQTVTRMNAHAETGEDPDFGRGSTAYQRNLGDPAVGPNPTLGPIGTPPFYAVRLYPGDIGAASGLVTDASARVLGAGDRPIGGLYAVGNDMNSIMGGVYPGPGITLGPAIVFAHIAAADMAARQDGDAP